MNHLPKVQPGFPLHYPTLPHPCSLRLEMSIYAGTQTRCMYHTYCRACVKGSNIGFNCANHCRAATQNLRSVHEHPEIVDAYLEKEVGLGHVFCCSKSEAFSLPGFTISPIGVIPKCNNYCQNKWRLIVDLSSPKGASINNGIGSSSGPFPMPQLMMQ